jgi:ADP-ribosyl-[dinitrogen reductase] hydrolase
MNHKNKDIKTSTSHPLRIDEINIPGCRGRIGMTFCPGKKQLNAACGIWDHSLKICICTIGNREYKRY